MIISASRRTDISAFYSEWFMNRLNEGHVLVPNPMNPHQVGRVRLDPEVAECIVFWSKNPEPMLTRLPELNDYKYYFQYTLNAYGHDIEPGLPALERRIYTFIRLSAAIGPGRVIWRYDPIFVNDTYTIEWHIERFAYLADLLYRSTKQCTISFVDHYPKNSKSMKQAAIQPMTDKQILVLAKAFGAIAGEHGLSVMTCSEAIDLADYGIGHASCIDRNLIEKITGKTFASVKKDKNQRSECGCIASIDIGIYNTCVHGCAYCYANFSEDRTRRNFAAHDPDSLLLVGELSPDAVVKDREMIVQGVTDRQTRLD